MLEVIFAVLLVGLATNRAVEVWHHSVIFAKPRTWVKTKRPRFIHGIATCPFCLSYHVSLWLAVLATCAFGLPWLSLPLTWLGGVYVANTLNDTIKTKTPRANYDEDLEAEVTDGRSL